jgi:hypothetical protein
MSILIPILLVHPLLTTLDDSWPSARALTLEFGTLRARALALRLAQILDLIAKNRQLNA